MFQSDSNDGVELLILKKKIPYLFVIPFSLKHTRVY